MFLTDSEITQLTGRTRHKAQAKVLDFMGIPYKSRPDGSLVVLRFNLAPSEEKPSSPRLRLSFAR
jgi:hypothetical protein